MHYVTCIPLKPENDPNNDMNHVWEDNKLKYSLPMRGGTTKQDICYLLVAHCSFVHSKLTQKYWLSILSYYFF